MIVFLLILIYLVSIPLCLLANKLAYKKEDAAIVPIIWFIPILNSASILVLLFNIL